MNKIAYDKYQGLGNDFIIFKKEDVESLKWSDLAKAVCNRRFGIGADGMVILSPADDIRMDFYNSDGSIAPMCGNASRCVAYYVREKEMINCKKFILNTLGGDVAIELLKNGLIRVNLGKPKFQVADIPAIYHKNTLLQEPVIVNGHTVDLSAVFMTTSHSTLFIDQIKEEEVRQLGPQIENLAIFPQKINVNFAKISDEHTIHLVTWERGAGRTLACGTGACATVAIADHLGMLKGQIEVITDGGSLFIEVVNGDVLMTGSAQKIADGNFYYTGK